MKREMEAEKETENMSMYTRSCTMMLTVFGIVFVLRHWKIFKFYILEKRKEITVFGKVSLQLLFFYQLTIDFKITFCNYLKEGT